MARLAIFTERNTIRRAVELTALTNFRMAAAKLGKTLDQARVAIVQRLADVLREPPGIVRLRLHQKVTG